MIGGPNNNGANHLRDMYRSIRPHRRARHAALVLATLAGGLFVAPAQLAAQTPDASDIAEGARLFHQKGNCQSCHGWAGDGRKMD